MLNADYAQSIIKHMNDDHSDAVLAYVHAFTPHANASSANVTAIDTLGIDIEFTVGTRTERARVEFPEPLSSDDQVRPVLVKMVKQAREVLAGS